MEHFKMFRNFLKSSNGTLRNVSQQIPHEHFSKFKIFSEHFWQLSRTLWVVLKHFSLNNLKCLQTPSGTFWMFMNILKSSNGTFWNVPQQISSWTFLIVLKKIPIFFWVCSQTFFTRHFDLKCLQTCSGTFWMFRNILKSSNGTFWNFLYVQEHFKKFQRNILNCSETF